MRRFLLALILLLLPSVVFAGYPADGRIIFESRSDNTVAAGGGGLYCDAIGTNLLCEDLEGSSACGDGSHSNCRNTWTLANWTTTDFNYATAPAPLGDSFSMYLDASSSPATAIKTFTGAGTVYSKFMFTSAFVSVSGGASYRFMQYDDVTRELCAAQVKDVSGTLRFSVMNNSGSADGATLTFTGNTTYYIWLDYQKGAGTGYCKLYANTTDSKPGSPEAQLTSQNLNYDVSRVQILIFAGSVDQNIYDDLVLKSTSF